MSSSTSVTSGGGVGVGGGTSGSGVGTTTTTTTSTSTTTSNMSQTTLLFVIVGKNEPLYEAEFNKLPGSVSTDSVTRQNYFVLHSSLDLVDKALWSTNSMYLKTVDKVNNQHVSCFVTAGNIKFMLLHGGRSEDSIKNFFTDVYELYVKLAMNPFYQYDTPILSKSFDTRVKAIARRYLS